MPTELPDERVVTERVTDDERMVETRRLVPVVTTSPDSVVPVEVRLPSSKGGD